MSPVQVCPSPGLPKRFYGSHLVPTSSQGTCLKALVKGWSNREFRRAAPSGAGILARGRLDLWWASACCDLEGGKEGCTVFFNGRYEYLHWVHFQVSLFSDKRTISIFVWAWCHGNPRGWVIIGVSCTGLNSPLLERCDLGQVS